MVCRYQWIAAFALAAAGCISQSTRQSIATAERDAVARPAPAEDRRGTAPVADETTLAKSVDLPTLEATAVARNPGLVEAAYRVRALTADARSEGSLPPPQFMAELWMVPLARPYALQDAGML